jgi:hypothetical protein
MVVLLGGLGFIGGLWLVRVVLDKVRMSGEISTI